MFDPFIFALGPVGAAVIVVLLGGLLASPVMLGVAAGCSDDASALSRRFRRELIARRERLLSAGELLLQSHSPRAAFAAVYTKLLRDL